MDYFPLFARLTGAPCLVAGGGQVGLRKVRRLLSAGAAVEVVADEFIPDFEALATDPRLTLRRARFDASLIREHLLIFAATGDPAVNAEIAAAAAAANRFCNVVDDAELSSAIIPAVVDRTPLLVAVSTGGESPVMATRVRQQIESLLPHSTSRLARFAGEWRTAVKQTFADADKRRHFWQDMLTGPLAHKVLEGDMEGAREIMERGLAATPPARGVAWIVGAGPGDPELLTLKALRLLGAADVVLHDRLIAPEILAYARRDAEFIPVGKQAGRESIGQQEINDLLVRLVESGKRVCRLKGGDPFIFGRGGEEVAALRAAGLSWQIVPGITAASGCAAAAGVPLTHRELARSVVFATAYTSDDSEPQWETLGSDGQTVVFYMGLGRLDAICTKLLAAGRRSDLPALLIANGTTGQQRCIRGTLTTLAVRVNEAELSGPGLVIIGDVAGLAVDHLSGELANELAEDNWLPAAAGNNP
ncbi:MAG: siroheme synthase CysG [Gammaproteobacteria bacterium]|jgi:uroporphyrin-III C-methyltransferase/precorrin-2 dehydrogenase/sirohydrochlorin ferrochelatase|nr:siroheme synthase CysG [Gammaproteobacteria bacterium]MDP6617318.1 siroheme synthase CysG [Gammaproteobacteria bacterium]MDP6694096.1 siroheme synthase CysG [Gammaproteobacteria bacterium]